MDGLEPLHSAIRPRTVALLLPLKLPLGPSSRGVSKGETKQQCQEKLHAVPCQEIKTLFPIQKQTIGE